MKNKLKNICSVLLIMACMFTLTSCKEVENAEKAVMLGIVDGARNLLYTEPRKAVSTMRFMVKILLLPLVLASAFLALMLRWTLNLSAFILALPMMYIFGCGLYTLYCREWTQFLILLVAEFGCFLLITAGTVIVEAVEWFSGWIAEL